MAMRTHNRTQYLTRSQTLEVELDNELHLLPENVSHYVAREAVKRMDEMALIGYPILTLEQRSVYEVVIRQVVEGVS